MVIAGSDRATRRRSVRRQRALSPPTFGPELRQAREGLFLSLAVISDRTGVHSRDLEALEAGDLARFRDERAALVAVRRFADTVGLDAVTISQAVEAQWRSVAAAGTITSATTAAAIVAAPAMAPGLTGVTPATRGDLRAPAPAPVVSTPIGRHAGDAPHLRAFTQTAQVPQVAGAPRPQPTLPPGLRFDSTDAIPVTSHRAIHDPDPTSLSLRVAVWTVVLLLFVGVAGLSVDHWRPGWLAQLHLVASTPTVVTSHGPGGHQAPKAPIVTSTTSGPRAASVTVRSPGYQVVVATQVPCWIHVTSPASAAPIFSATVPAGTTKIFTSVQGQLSVELGASHALVAVQILGKTVPGWLLAPSAVPYVLTFHSAAT